MPLARGDCKMPTQHDRGASRLYIMTTQCCTAVCTDKTNKLTEQAFVAYGRSRNE